MRRTLMTLAAGAVTLAAGAIFPAGALAATASPAHVPVTYKSLYVAGYRQVGCQYNGYPGYTEIQGTLTVPAATDLNGTPGESTDILNLGGLGSGVSAGVFVGSDAGQAYYHAFWQWEGTSNSGTAPFPVAPGDQLHVTVDEEGSSGWMVDIADETTGQNYSVVLTRAFTFECEAGAYERSPFPTYTVTTRTFPVVFDGIRVRWDEQATGLGMSRLLGTPPPGARLYRYNLENTSGALVAVTSKPTHHDNNFIVFDI